MPWLTVEDNIAFGMKLKGWTKDRIKAQTDKIIELMGHDWYKGMEHVSFGMVSYEGRALSTREGYVVYLEDLLNKAVEKAREIIEEKIRALVMKPRRK